jgi:hypothetical protein
MPQIGKESELGNEENTNFSLYPDGMLINASPLMHGGILIDEDASHATPCANSRIAHGWEYNAFESLSNSMW